MSRAPDLTALVSSRICHDLISPIGAIGNGVELLNGPGGPVSPELDLIEDSVNSAADKLRCFRIAFGQALPGSRIGTGEVSAAAAAMFRGRSSVSLSVADAGSEVSRRVAKALLLTLLCQEKCLPLGGDSTAAIDPDGFRVETRTTRLRENAELWALTEGAPPQRDIAPGEVQFLLLAAFLSETKARFRRQLGETRLEFTVTGLADQG